MSAARPGPAAHAFNGVTSDITGWQIALIAVGPQWRVPSWACFWTGPGQPAVTGPRRPPELVAPGRQLAGGAADDGGVSKLTAAVSDR
jgi:hypothetical protein